MRNGTTGERFKAKIFHGISYYQRLRHMVLDKMYARTEGPVDNITRQPVHGRAKSGGLRLGEMERDVLIAHGSSKLIEERYNTSSDHSEIKACRTCGRIHTICDGVCFYCKEKGDVVDLDLPTSSQVLFSELRSAGIDTVLNID